MTKVFIAIIVFICCATSLNAQERKLPTTLDDFAMYTFVETASTKELIPNAGTIIIHRNYGIPRFGEALNNSNTVDTIMYIPNDFVRPQSGGINTPLLTDTSLTVWWKEGTFNVKIMDVQTGNVVMDNYYQGQSVDQFGDRIDTLELANSDLLVFDGGSNPVEPTNSGVHISYNHIPNGLYWVYIADNSKNIWYMKTIRKGL